MAVLTEKELLTEISESGHDFENIVIGTYSVEPEFFEEVILPVIEKKDPKNIVLLVDQKYYNETFQKARKAGTNYLIEPIRANGRFHPKFLLMTSAETAKLFIGSGNFTQNGCMRSGEVYSLIDYDLSFDHPEMISVYKDLKKFLVSLNNHNLVTSNKHKERILEAFELPWINKETVYPSSKIWLLYNTNKSILQQVKEIMKNEQISKITIASPFFEIKGIVLRHLTENFCPNLELFIQPDRVENFPVETIKVLIDEGKEIRVKKLVFTNEPKRYLHAKILIFQTKNGSYCLTGSANATRAGLLSEIKTGNVELNLLRYENKSDYFDYLINNTSLSDKTIKIDQLKPNIRKDDDEGGTSPDIWLDDAHIEGNQLIINFHPSIKDRPLMTAIITRPGITKQVILTQKLSTQDENIFDLDEETKNFCSYSCYVKIKLHQELTSDIELESNNRWISTERLELTPRNRDVRIIEKTNGRIGLIRLMNQLKEAVDSPSMLLYYLQFIDFSWLEDTINKQRRRIMEKNLEESESPDESAEYELGEFSAEIFLEKLVYSHDKKLRKSLKELEGLEDYESRIKNIFDLFLFVNKIVIWFILNYKYDNELLLEIVDMMEDLVGTRGRYLYIKQEMGYFEHIYEKMGKTKFSEIFDKMNVDLHFAVLSKIIQHILLSNSQPEILEQIKAKMDDVVCFAHKMRLDRNIADLTKKEICKEILQEYQEYDEYNFFNLSENRIPNLIIDALENGQPKKECKFCNKETAFKIADDIHVCPSCAKDLIEKEKKKFVLMECRICSSRKWMDRKKRGKIPIKFCKACKMVIKSTPGTFYIPNLVDPIS
ncbi:MAG: hypothetical protein NUK62_08220 [Tenericutes bacterium]|nr:hypothetical protein [Mycoplasmatota bacterium]